MSSAISAASIGRVHKNLVDLDQPQSDLVWR